MFYIRAVTPSDLDDLVAVSGHLDSVNLPDDPEGLRGIIERSQRAFAGKADPARRDFTFVLLDRASGGTERVIGCSMIFAQHGSRRAPHVYFDVFSEDRYSETVDRLFQHRVLRIGYDFKGLTEIGGLALLPEYRSHPDKLGRLLSFVRFVYIAMHRDQFRDEVLAELMPPLQPDGTSLLWASLGQRFTGMSYQEADRLSRENKEFIKALFPQSAIYTCLLAPEAQAQIGEVGATTKGVERLLRRIGFSYADRIDPFDGGPHFHAPTDSILPVRATRAAVFAEENVSQPRTLIVCVAPPEEPGVRIVQTQGELAGERVVLDAPARDLLGLRAGATVHVLPLDAAGPNR